MDPGNRVSQAIFRCLSCGHETNADINAAENIRRQGLENLGQGRKTRLGVPPETIAVNKRIKLVSRRTRAVRMNSLSHKSSAIFRMKPPLTPEKDFFLEEHPYVAISFFHNENQHTKALIEPFPPEYPAHQVFRHVADALEMLDPNSDSYIHLGKRLGKSRPCRTKSNLPHGKQWLAHTH